jgi:hypothetical protein
MLGRAMKLREVRGVSTPSTLTAPKRATRTAMLALGAAASDRMGLALPATRE